MTKIQTNNISILCNQADLLEHATVLSKRLSIPLINTCPADRSFKYLLVYTPNTNGYQLELQFPDEKLKPVLVDFLSSKLQHRKNFGGGRQQAIAKAVGLKRGYSPKLLDGTAGLGKDAFILAALDCQVTMCERNPVIHALLEDGLRRLHTSPNLAPNLRLQFENSSEHLQQNLDTYDVIYLDPMYPHRTKSALVKKEMRIIRQLVGDDTDFDNLMEMALTHAKKRVVIKRPKTAAPIGAIPPSHSIESKKTRFDVYLLQGNIQ